jgi:rod shape-determining protein MreC
MKKLPYRLVLIVFSLAVLGFILSPLEPVTNARGFSQKILFYPKRGADIGAQNVSDWFLALFLARQMVAIVSLQANIQSLKEKEAENELLKKQLGFIQSQKEGDFLPVQVTSYSASGGRCMVWIDQGEKAGVKKDQAVLSQGYLAGKVIVTTLDASQVILISSSNLMVPATLKGGGMGLLHGSLAGLELEDVPTTSKIEIGQEVATSSLGAEWPAGLPIGQVKKILSSPSEVFQKVLVSSPLNFTDLKFISVKIR